MILPYKIALIGPPGSGKGTQAVRLAKELNIPAISPGQMYREEVAQGTELGKIVERYTRQGTMVPEEINNDMLAYRISQPDCVQGFILDGYPRNLMQMGALETMSEITDAIVLKINDKESLRRLTGRLICGQCGDSFHVELRQPKAASVCDTCGAQLIRRDDDRPDVITRRLNAYHRDTEPMIYYYERTGIARIVNGEGTIDEVYTRVLEVIKRS